MLPNIDPERRYWISQAASLLDIHVSTVIRWATKGLGRGDNFRVLRTAKIGGRRACMGHDLIEFLSVEADPADLGIRSPTKRQRASDRAARQLEELGA